MRLNFNLLHLGAAVLTGLLFTTGCSKEDGLKPLDDVMIQPRGPINGTPVSTALIGLSPNNELINMMSGPPAIQLDVIPITGLRSEELIIAIDTRPKNKQLFGVSNFSTIYRIDPVSGGALRITPTTFTPAISGGLVGFDFSSSDDMIRLVCDNGQNLRISPTTGNVVSVDVNINSFTAAINSIAYAPSSFGSKSIVYDIDISGSVLYKSGTPNTGAIQLVGPLGFNFSGEGGFDITSGGVGFTVQYGSSRFPTGGGAIGGVDDTTQDAHRLFNINLRTGAATSYGKVRPMIGLAVK